MAEEIIGDARGAQRLISITRAADADDDAVLLLMEVSCRPGTNDEGLKENKSD